MENLEKIQRIYSAHTDSRGEIFNVFEGMMHHIAHITCNAGVIRANHYHKTLHQYMYCISGEFESWSCDINNPKKKQMLLVKAGDIVDTPPNVAHTQKFTQNSVVIALSTKPRSKGQYENDTHAFQVIEGYMNPELIK